jgi:hypothetical protein
MKLPIADCRLSIGKLLSRRSLARGRHDCRKLVRFGQKRGKFSLGHDAGLDKQFEPQCRLVCFFFDRSNFGDEFSLATRPATSAIISRHRSSASHDLPGKDTSRVVTFGNRSRQLNDSQGESFGAGFQFSWGHGSKLQTQSAIGNRQSSMPL